MKIHIPEDLPIPPTPTVTTKHGKKGTYKDVLPPLVDRIPAVPTKIPPRPKLPKRMPLPTMSDNMPPIPLEMPPVRRED